MNIGLTKQIQEITPIFSANGDNFIVKINDFQVLATLKEETYEVDIMKNYTIIKSWNIKEEDILYFLIYFKDKTKVEN